MDVVSSIVRIAAVGTRLSTTLLSYSNAVADADKNMARIAGDVALTSNVLRSVGNFLKEKDNDTVATPSALEDANSMLKGCNDIFAEIKEIIDKNAKTNVDGRQGLKKRAKLSWPANSQHVELLQSRLERLKSSLMLLLQVLSVAKDWAAGYSFPGIILHTA
jgi:hypothetical protein